jgi:hypothetical protein
LEKNKYVPIVINKNGNLISERKHVAKLFNAYFTEIAERLQCNFTPGVLKYCNGNHKLSASILFTPTNDDEITGIIKDLKNKQSSGLDGFSRFLIKKCYVYLIKPLTFLTNLSLSTGKFPENLKIAKTKPLFKKGAPNEIENYRPVSLVSTFSKILEKVVCISLINFLEKHNMFIESQHGFRKGKCTSTALVNFLEDVYKTLDNKEVCVGLFLDLSKVFDMVNHNILLQKLDTYGIRGIAHQWFASYLKNRKQLVEIDNLDVTTH